MAITRGSAALFTPASGLRLAGKTTTEATTTATSTTDLVTVSGLSIPATTPIWLQYSTRRTGGAAESVTFGIKLNTTLVHEGEVYTSEDATGNGIAVIFIGPRVTNYLRTGMVYNSGVRSGGGTANIRQYAFVTANQPTATITQVVITGKVSGGSVTAGASQAFVWTPQA